MNSLCDISDPDYEKQLKKSRQVNRSEVICKVISFLENQRGIRTMYIGAPDQNSIQKEKKKQSKMTKASIDQQLTQSGPSRCAHLTNATISELLNELDTEDSEDTEDNVSNVDSVSTDSSFDEHYSHYTPPDSKQRKRELTVSLEVSTKTRTLENTPAADLLLSGMKEERVAILISGAESGYIIILLSYVY
jgi:hypothetical protein